MKVVKFSIGFGPRLLGFRRGETEYLLSILPLGGYVKMAGDEPGAEVAPEDRGRGFLEAAPWKRFVIAFAGPAANLIFPVVIYFALALAQNGSNVPGPTLGTVMPGSAAERGGLRAGDRVVSLSVAGSPEKPIRYFSDLRQAIGPRAGERIDFTVERGGQRLTFPVVPAPEKESNPVETVTRGVIGVSPAWPAAVVAPILPGSAGPLAPFDLVVRAAGEPVRNMGDLDRVIAAAACAPVDLEVLREAPVGAPGVAVSSYDPVKLGPVPTCAGGEPAFRAADPTVSTFVAEVVPGSPADKAGLRRGDAITSVNGKPVRSFRELNQLSADFLSGTPVRLGLSDGRATELVPVDQEYVDEMTRETRKRVTLGFFPEQRGIVQARALVAEEVPLSIGPGRPSGAPSATSATWCGSPRSASSASCRGTSASRRWAGRSCSSRSRPRRRRRAGRASSSRWRSSA